MNLRDALLDGLRTVPGSREFHVHVLVSRPRKHWNLYPFAAPRAKTFQQHILVLLAEETGEDGRRVFVTGIEAFLYQIPTTSCGVLYVSKVDSTGQAKMPSPTATLVRGLVGYYVDPETRPIAVDRVWVHLFARAQNQYLFPNSSEFAGKRALSDMELCGWWKRQLGRVAEGAGARTSMRLWYLLPGLVEAEAVRVVGEAGGAWTYGHPYGQEEVQLPWGAGGHVGGVIPWFEDDPKARFLDEIAYTTEAEGVKSPERKRGREEVEVVEEAKVDEGTRRVRRVTVEEFWERMSFRQECTSGQATGFFVMSCSGGAGAGAGLVRGSGEVSGQMVERVLTSLMTGHDFGSVEKAVRSTGVLEETIRGLCEGNTHVYGSLRVRNAECGRVSRKSGDDDDRKITVLTARRKTRKGVE